MISAALSAAHGRAASHAAISMSSSSVDTHDTASGLFVGCEAQIFTAVAKSGILLTCKEQLVRYTVALVLAFSRRPPALPAPANRG